MQRSKRTIVTHYIPEEWGIKMVGEEVKAFIRFVRTDNDYDYKFYGDDADTYREFEREGFVMSTTTKTFKEANEWLNSNIY